MGLVMNRIPFLVLIACISLPAYAVDDPAVDDGVVKYDEKMCINDHTNDCVNTNCLTSEERDCTDKCKEGAEDKCAGELME